MARDLQLVDDYLAKWDEFAQGNNRLTTFLGDKKSEFEAALTRLLEAGDNRAPARMVFYPVVQVGGFILADSKLGMACAKILGPEFPVTTQDSGERTFFCGDLYFWWQDNRTKFEPCPLFDEWSKRVFARTVVVPMYKSACKRR